MTKGRESKPHIGIYGRRNTGKSSLVNCITGQDIAIVADQPGVTTDPVKKSFEITGYGPVILIDTAGTDDSGNIGAMRVDRTLKTIDLIDLAILVITDNLWGQPEDELVKKFNKSNIPFIVIYNKSDIAAAETAFKETVAQKTGTLPVEFSTTDKRNYETLISLINEKIPEKSFKTPALVGSLIKPGYTVMLITPTDIEAPAGRLILPQVQTIRDILDNNAVSIVLKEIQVEAFLKKTGIIPALVITDSQVFKTVDALIPAGVPLTSFSILLARLKGDFDSYLKGVHKILQLKDGDRVLILESCSHHIACDDIGREKMPIWISAFTGKKIEFDIVAGLDPFPHPITAYSLAIQCGACMITRKQLLNRISEIIKAGVPVSNYGMVIAFVQGIFNRAVAPLI
ncbi:MAG: [FeFe] hydrogenase H-cluster maturation GTPase HydF [Bacteroidales bacterium]|jgi:[FeFe] hydrogenase H-cluster maturation GTPase HydF|nr:[FeFe] hydrogenase H-cluster maturation GTPase HydF [Bacteroidales bacterium]